MEHEDIDPPTEHPNFAEDVCYADDETMLAWCKEENLPVEKDEDGHYDWSVSYRVYCERMEGQDTSIE